MQTNSFSTFLSQISSDFIPVITASIPEESYFPLDLSSENDALLSIDISSSLDMEAYIDKLLLKKNARVAYGGYLEKRAIYQRSTHFNQENPETERNIHLGMDLWLEAGTDVLAVLDGEIHSFKDNTNFGDYGPTIILKHKRDSFEFYTLYGHLNRESLTKIYPGQKVKQGEVIAQLGAATVNGDYAPHLHFQVIKEIENFMGDYPGVCSKKDFEYYSKNCPNPNLLLKIS
tara:strand:- start:80328 stop:81020 length:693 start_codon:yes stop_codon:yes gene_type:complete